MARQLFEVFIAASENYSLVNSITDADMADYYCERHKIDLILMDICTAMDSNGLDAAERIKKRFPEIKIIVVTSMPEYSYLRRAREIGADSFWYKEISEEPILALMDRTMKGEHIFPDTTPEVYIGEASSYEFTDREIEVLRELSKGASNPEIGKTLNMASGTVKNHIERMLNKTGFETRTRLAVEARRLGLVIEDKKRENDS